MTQAILGQLNPLELALVGYLCIVFPSLQFYRSLKKRRAGAAAKEHKSSGFKRFMRMFAYLGLPLIALAVDWPLADHTRAALGLQFPPSLRGLVGLAFAVVLVVGAFLSSMLIPNRASAEKLLEQRQSLEDAGLMIRSPADLLSFVALMLLVGCGSEILFRGFLVWAFAPLAGIAGAVVIAALAYGMGHGFKTWAQLAGSIAAAFAFTIAYALTHSLWWLMVVHSSAGMVGAWSGYRLSRQVQGGRSAGTEAAS